MATFIDLAAGSTITLSYSEGMRRLLEGGWIGEANANIAREVLMSTVGRGSTALSHFTKGQSSWHKLSPKTLKDRRKKSKQIFVHTRRTLRAIVSKPVEGKLTRWGSSADIRSTAKLKLRYNANGIWSSAEASKDGLSLSTGFAGTLKHSAGFNRVRKQLAVERGLDLSKIPSRGRSKAINKMVSVAATQSRIRSKGLRIPKFAAKGSIGISGNKHILARGRNNLAHANIVQAGPLKGIRNNRTGRTYAPRMVPIARARGKLGSDYTEVRGKHPRPLMPYLPSDAAVLSRAVERGVNATFRKLERGSVTMRRAA